MVPTRTLVIGVALVFLLAAPLATAQRDGQTVGIQNPYETTPTTLYMHIDGIQDFPINTQLPDDRFLDDQGYGLATNSLSCVGDPTGALGAAGVGKSYHTYYGYSTPGYVQYDFEEDGKPRYHKERGISFDVDLDTSQPMTIYWYLETQATGVQSDANQAPVVVPNVMVKATMRSGDAIGVGDGALNEGQVIAQGRTEAVTLAAEMTAESEQVSYRAVNGKHVYEFAIPMDFQQDKISRDDSYNIRIDVYKDNPLCNDPSFPEDEYMMSNTVRVHTSPGNRPRADLAIMNPIKIEYIHPQFIGDEMVIHTSMNAPWGNYDVDETPGGIEFHIAGPTEATSVFQAAFVQRHHEHDHHQEPVDVTWVWPYKEDGARDGIYTVHLSVWNHQRTAQAVGEVQFQIGKGDGQDALPPCNPDIPISEQVNCRITGQGTQSQESPGVGVVAAVALLALLALAAGRRR